MSLNRINRRRFGALSAVSAATVCTLKTRALAKPQSTPQFQVGEIRTITPASAGYCGWPTLTRRSNGQLVVVWSGGRESHVCPFGRVEMIRSDDNGKTWSWPRTLIDGAIDDRDAGIVETAKGTLLATTFTSLAYQSALDKQIEANKAAGNESRWTSEKLNRWLGVHERISEQQRQDELGQWMLRSTDGGITWSRRYGCIVNSPHGPIQLSDGRLLYAGKELWTGNRDVGVCVSDDDGQTWSWLAKMPVRQGDAQSNYHELHAVEASNGRLIVHIRNHNPANRGETLQSESDDGGKTWTEPHSIGVWGLPSFLTRLSDGRLMMTYGHRRKPLGVQARISADHGETWGEPMVLWGEAANGDLGYPSTVQLDDQGFLTVWYEWMPDQKKAVLRQADWRLVD